MTFESFWETKQACDSVKQLAKEAYEAGARSNYRHITDEEVMDIVHNTPFNDMLSIIEDAIRKEVKPKPLTEEEIRDCWSKCGKQAPMAFAEELQRKLGVL